MKKNAGVLVLAVLAAALTFGGCGKAETGKTAETASGQEAEGFESGDKIDGGGDETAAAADGQDGTAAYTDVVEDWMVPIGGSQLMDGVYPVTVDSSSSMFRVTDCLLTVEGQEMRAVLTMSGTGYGKLYMGTGEEAADAPEKDWIPAEVTAEDVYTFTVPVEALDQGIACAAYSKKKERWYDRTLVFRADSLPSEAWKEGALRSGTSLKTVQDLAWEDGIYTVEVTLEGGSGRASIESPAALRIEDGKAFAVIVWGSSNYDYMKVDGEKIEAMEGTETSSFEIPVSGFDGKLSVIADTIAMSQPHEITYQLTFDSESVKKAD